MYSKNKIENIRTLARTNTTRHARYVCKYSKGAGDTLKFFPRITHIRFHTSTPYASNPPLTPPVCTTVFHHCSILIIIIINPFVIPGQVRLRSRDRPETTDSRNDIPLRSNGHELGVAVIER